MRIAFALIAHYPADERVYSQLAATLKQAGNTIFILSALTDACDLPDTQCFDSTGMSKKALIRRLQDCLANCQPDVVICDNPIAILAAQSYKSRHKTARIIYDVTEWYPSKKNLRTLSFGKKMAKALVLSALSVYAGRLTDAFIFGEYYKARPFRFLFFWKKYSYLSYYADIHRIESHPPQDIRKECRLFYSGASTKEKGLDSVWNVSRRIAGKHPEIQFTLTVVTGTPDDAPGPFDIPQNLRIQRKTLLPFPDFCKEIGQHDLFFDLRVNDFENTRSLPIKLFYYMACSRPLIYSDLKSIRREVPEMEQMGYLVNPNDWDAVCECVSNYLSDDDLYKSHCAMAGKAALEKYNWDNIKGGLIQLIAKL